MDSAIIRKATVKDIKEIVPLWIDLLDFHKKFSKRMYRFKKNYVEIYKKFLDKCLRARNAQVFVAEKDGKVIGHCIVRIKDIPPIYEVDREAWVDEIVVKKEFRGKGAGKKLLAASEQWAKERGLKELSLTVHSKNKKAIESYTKNGLHQHHIKMSKWL
ncbi:GNAT family N-acetyltransferase [Candidatus Altiarchaeota archaeon]